MSTSRKRSDAPPEVEKLKQLLHYQDKAVVSRMLAKNAGGSVPLFAFDGGEGSSEHTAPFDAPVIGIEGVADVQVGGVGHRIAEGETLRIPGNVPHGVSPAGAFKMLPVMIRGDKPV